jgi:hypothetical protein
MSKNHYAVIFQCKEATSAFGTGPGKVMTTEGTEAIVTKGEGWGPTSFSYQGTIPDDVLTFSSEERAHDFMKGWEGHPWYYTPNGKYRVVPLKAKTEEVIVGYQEAA